MRLSLRLLVPAVLAITSVAALEAAPPAVGQPAPDFRLPSLSGSPVALSEVAAKGPVVLVVLRGYPGYQCPMCSRQVQKLLGKAQAFEDAGAHVVMVYPGPADRLAERAAEFTVGKTLPAHFHLLLDPDYTFTRLYSLRWDAPKETAYPATFVMGRDRVVRFAKVSDSHGGRASAAEVLAALGAR